MSEFKWTDEKVSEFVGYIRGYERENLTPLIIEDFKILHSNTHTVKADESNVVDGGSKNDEINIVMNKETWDLFNGGNEVKVIIKKQKPILFTTEDGKNIYKGNRFYYVDLIHYDAGFLIADHELESSEYFKYFSTEEAANTYIFHKKLLLSYDDVSELYESLINRFGRPFLEQLKELVKSKINK